MSAGGACRSPATATSRPVTGTNFPSIFLLRPLAIIVHDNILYPTLTRPSSGSLFDSVPGDNARQSEAYPRKNTHRDFSERIFWDGRENVVFIHGRRQFTNHAVLWIGLVMGSIWL